MLRIAKLLNCLIAILIIIFVLKNDIFASVRINEIYPAAPTGEYEWVELYNDGNEFVNLSSYSISDQTDKQLKLNSLNIAPLNFVIATSSSVLNNDGDSIQLKNGSEEIETISYPGGFNSDKTYAKCPDGSDTWIILTTTTKNSSNNHACQNLSPTLSPTVEEDTRPTSNFQLQTYNNIYLSEVMVDSESGNNEWVELFNENDYQVMLTDWYLDDSENTGSTPKKFALTLEAKSFGVYELTNSIFNNDGDSVRLLDFKQIEKDSFQYQSSEKGKTLGRINFTDDTFCPQNPSKGTV